MTNNQSEISRRLRAERAPSLLTGDLAKQTVFRSIWNTAAFGEPLGVIRCDTLEALSATLRALEPSQVPLSVFSGGHDPFGRSCRAGSIVLDVSGMTYATLQPGGTSVRIGGGTRTIDLLNALPGEIAAVTGTIGTVGLAGLLMGGGYGRLTSQFGLASDQLVAADLVLLNGEVLHVDETSHPELFWALRGGGGNFGVVSAMTLRVHSVPNLLSALIFFSLEHASRALHVMQTAMDEASEHLSLFAGFMSDPSGNPLFFVAPLWVGPERQGQEEFDRFTSLTGATVINREWTQYRALFSEEFEKGWPKGRNYSMDVQSVPGLGEDTIQNLVHAAQNFTSPSSAIVMHDFRGVATQVDPLSSAFTRRTPHYAIQLVAGWDGPSTEDGNKHRRWVEDTSSALAHCAMAGSYVSLMNDPDGSRTRAFYGPASAKLMELKRKFDPHTRLQAAGAHEKPLETYPLQLVHRCN